MSSSELSILSNESIQAALKQTIEDQLKTTEYETIIGPACKKGDNFLGIVYRVTCKKAIHEEQDETPLELNLILKVAPYHPERREASPSRRYFMREMYLFDEVFPYFREFEKSKGIISMEDGFHEYPACFKTINTKPTESLILQDLCIDNFVMIDHRNENITADHVNLVMHTLGKLHAISFAVKDQQPEKFKQLSCNINELFVRTDDEHLKKVMQVFRAKELDIAEKFEDKRIGAKIKQAFDGDLVELSAKAIDSRKAEPYAVICHGDCWNNNTMFKLDANRTPVDVRLLDFQISRYGSPVLDILYYIFCCTQKELRDQHYDNFLQIYHSSLSKHLERLGSDVEKVFPFSAMLDQFRVFGIFGLYIASLLLPMITLDANCTIDLDAMVEDMNNGKEVSKDIIKSEGAEKRLAERLSGVFYDMDRLGYI